MHIPLVHFKKASNENNEFSETWRTKEHARFSMEKITRLENNVQISKKSIQERSTRRSSKQS